ncbi:MAG: hypothetical protein IPG63_03260 [Xanthomonadales bacterium]|nr:hypothetical protein [Xanthomonadales bacterium]MBK7144075.1 hypothetical protein [Xanthomonadales bacterium]MCC6560556.1 hypothetical protein [Xanthomonadales bacterium]
MSLVHPMQRLQVAAIMFAVLGGAALTLAEPASSRHAERCVANALEARLDLKERVDVHARSAWREHLPAVFIVRHRRPT